MNGRTIRSAAVWLCAVLTFTTLLVVLGRSDDRTFPSITSSKPSGTRLLSEVLEVNGIRVRQDRSRIPQTRPDEVVIAFVRFRGERPLWTDRSLFSATGSESGVQRLLKDHAANGGRVVIAYVNESLREGTRAVSEPTSVTPVFQTGGSALKVSAALRFSGSFYSGTNDENQVQPASSIDVWQGPELPLVTFHAVGKGTLVEVTDGIGFTNRFIDKYDNANFAVQLLAPLVPTDGSVVFAEASFGNMSEDSLISAIGGWARASLWQGLLLLVVVGWSLGTMFGLPQRSRLRQAGTRDLMHAFAHLLRRGKKREIAVENVMGALEREIRLSVGLPFSATSKQVQKRIPKTLGKALDKLRSESSPSVSEIESVRNQLRQLPGTRTQFKSEVD